MSKFIRVMETLWMLIAITAGGFSIHAIIKGDTEQSGFLAVISVVSLLMFWNRRKQRIKLNE